MNALVSNRPLTQVSSVKELLSNTNARNQLSAVAAKHMNPERMMRVLANAIRTTPKLAECNPMSLLGSLMQCASLGLEPNTQLGHAYLIPFENSRKVKDDKGREQWVKIPEVQLVIGYKGFTDLARRSGQVTNIHADVVYDDDELWSYEYGTEAHLKHKPGPRNGNKTHVYCYVKLTDGQAFVVLPWAQVMKTRNESQGWKSAVKFGKTATSPWSTHEDAMGRKTAVRALANGGEMPLSIEFMTAMEADSSRADFAGFAMQPDSGLTIEGETAPDENVDPETGEVTQIEDQRATQQTIEPEREKVSTTRRSKNTRTDSTPYTEGGPKAQGEQQAALDMGQPNKAGDEIAALVKELTEKMQGDIYDGAKLDETIELYEAKLERIRAAAPDQHKALIASLENYVASLD